MKRTLFPTDRPALEWTEFKAQGFSEAVSGVIYRTAAPPCCGVPLGGISTGCIDLDASGTFGFSSIFHGWMFSPIDHENILRTPRKFQLGQPFLGLSVGDKTWVLADDKMLHGADVKVCYEPFFANEERMNDMRKNLDHDPDTIRTPRVDNVSPATEIHYWGHYPVADLEYEIDAPVSVGLRAWSPFVPGDSAASNCPAALFEVFVRNPSDQPQLVTLAFNFPGPDDQEARGTEFTRQHVQEDFQGMLISSSGGVSYLLGVLNASTPVKFGASLNTRPAAWSKIGQALPQSDYREEGGVKIYHESACSASVNLTLEPQSEQSVRFVVAWYAPVWEGARNNVERSPDLRVPWFGTPHTADRYYYTEMYATRYASALEVARRVKQDYDALLKRVLAWQQTIYTSQDLPPWLRETLVNNLALIAEDSHWAQARYPMGDWVFPGGAFALNESPRGCPHMACIPCDWYGNLPIVYFFPELALSTLRIFRQYQKDTGEIPFALGKIQDLPDFATPEYFWQVSLNGMCYIDMVDRVWQRTGDDAMLRDFYESVKQCNTFTINLCSGPGGVISLAEIGGMEWFEYGEWAGMASHLGGLRLAMLRMMERMAQTLGDTAYVQQCQDWLAEGVRAMEEEMWTGGYYLNFYDKKTGKKSDDVMGYQLDGEWAADYHGLGGILQPDRVKTTLETIRRCNVALTPNVGAANFTRPDGSPLPQNSAISRYGLYAMFSPELTILAMTYIYRNEAAFGLELARRHFETLVLRQRHPWDLPNMVRGDTGARVFGTDYYQNMMLWAMPAAVAGQDLRQSSAPGSLVYRILQAGKST